MTSNESGMTVREAFENWASIAPGPIGPGERLDKYAEIIGYLGGIENANAETWVSLAIWQDSGLGVL